MFSKPIAIALALVVILTAVSSAEEDGISGFSGRTGLTCTFCHSGGVRPTVELSGPPAAPPGWMVSYVLEISGGQQSAGGLDVEASSGTLIASDTGTKLKNGEVTHKAPRTADASGNVTFGFDWTVPGTMGQETLWASGNSVNGNGKNTGDMSSTDSLSVEVRELALHVFPDTVPVGGTVNIRSFGGKPGGLAMLAVVDVNGISLFQTLMISTFDGAGEWLVSSPVPPSATGLTVTLMTLGIGGLSGKVKLTNQDMVSFQ